MVKATMIASLGAAVVVYAFCSLAALAAWAFAAHGDATVDDALRAGSFAFMAIHGAPLEIGSARFSLPLLGLMLVPIIVLSSALSRAWRRQPVGSRGEMLTLGGLSALPYLVFSLAVIVFWSSNEASIPIVSGLIWVMIVCTVATVLSWWNTVRPSVLANVAGPDLSFRTRRTLGGAVVLLLVVYVSAFIALTIAVIVNLTEIALVSRSLESGVVGLSALVALAIGWLPAALTWSSAYMLGPGFALGTDTIVSPFATRFGELPALPWLAAVPETSGGWHLVVLIVPVLAGVAVAGVLRATMSQQGPLRWWRASLASVVAAAVGMWALAWLTRGSLGQGRLNDFGAQPMSLFFAILLLGGLGASLLPLTQMLTSRLSRQDG
jgi:hypothetical protein